MRKREQYGYIGDKKSKQTRITKSSPLGFLSMLQEEERHRINDSDDLSDAARRSSTNSILDVETSKRTKVTHTGSDEYPRQPEPFAFGFLDLLELEEKKKLEELNAKVTPKKTRYEIPITLQHRETSLIIKTHTAFTKSIKLSSLSGVVFVFSLSSNESFEYISNLLDEYTLLAQNQKHAILLVGTHSDCEIEVSNAKIKELVRKHSIVYFPCSAQSNSNIQNIFSTFFSLLTFQVIHYPRWLSLRSSFKDKFSQAVVARNTTRIKQLLAQTPKSPSELLKCDWSLIHIAVWEGFFECVYLFLLYEPNCVHCTNSNGWTPLHIASRMGHIYIAEYLIEFGADPNALDSDNLSPLDTKNSKIRSLIYKAQETYRRNKGIKSIGQIQSIVSKIQASSITILDLSNAKLAFFPVEILECSQLTLLNLSFNMIKDISKEFSNLGNLEKLRMMHNEITAIPESVCVLSRIEVLDFRNNKVSNISPHIANLTRLKRLLLSYNMLTHLPSQVSSLEKTLEIFSIYGNPLSTLPVDVIPRLGDVHPSVMGPLMAYLKNISLGGKEEYNRVKIMFVGDGNVGKT